MRQLIIFIYSLLGLSCGSKETNSLKHLNPTKNMEWEDVDNLLKGHIEIKPSVEQGLADIKRILSKDNNQELTELIDITRVKNEFNDFLTKTLKENPLPKDIKGISFGLFTLQDNDKEKTAIYLCGAERTPTEDIDWNVDPLYFPKYYCILSDFETINKTYHSMTGDQEVLVFNGILNLLIMNSINEFKPDILKNQNTMYVGAGFDSGDTYILGQLIKD